MNILFINTTFRIFDGIDSGAANRSTMFVRALAQLGHVDVISFYKEPLVSDVENCDVVFSKYLPVLEIRRSRLARIVKKIWNHINVWSPYSYYELSKERENVVDNFYNKKKYDIVVCRYLEDAITCGLTKYAHKLVVEVDDNPVAAAKRQLAITDYPNPWSRYTTLYRANAIGLMAKNYLKKVLCSFHSNKLEPPWKGSVYLPNVPFACTNIKDVTKQTPMRLLIVGWLDYWPNKLGTKHFAENIFPEIKKYIPNIELHIVGKTNDEQFKEALNTIPGVNALGYVEDIENEYSNARICIVPVYHGAGTSVKFVEALSMKRAVISTPMGVRGYDDICKDKQDYILARTDEAFVEEIVSLITDIDRLNRIASSGYIKFSENFSQTRFFKIVEDTIRKAMESQKL